MTNIAEEIKTSGLEYEAEFLQRALAAIVSVARTAATNLRRLVTNLPRIKEVFSPDQEVLKSLDAVTYRNIRNELIGIPRGFKGELSQFVIEFSALDLPTPTTTVLKELEVALASDLNNSKILESLSAMPPIELLRKVDDFHTKFLLKDASLQDTTPVSSVFHNSGSIREYITQVSMLKVTNEEARDAVRRVESIAAKMDKLVSAANNASTFDKKRINALKKVSYRTARLVEAYGLYLYTSVVLMNVAKEAQDLILKKG